MGSGTQPQRWRLAAVLVGIWLVPGLLQCLQEVTYANAEGDGVIDVPHTLLLFLPTWLPWAAFTPGIAALARRFPLRRGTWRRALPLHVLAAIGFGGLHLLLLGLARTHFPPSEWTPRDLGTWILSRMYSLHPHTEVLAYAGVVTVVHAIDARRAARERELQAARLESQLKEARLDALRIQLQPHFLFNTLNAIDVLVLEDPPRAGRMLRHLAKLLRRTLEERGPLHSLADELDHLEDYLEIERTRFSDRLTVEIDAPPETQGLAVPGLLLQPLVENALRHGLAPRAEPGTVAVRARHEHGWLELAVEDDGVGLDPAASEGIGLGNTRARLANLYGERFELGLRARPEGGTRLSLRLPATPFQDVPRAKEASHA